MTPREVFDRHVRLFNEGIRTRNFGPMTSHFADNAEMYFEGIPVGPFQGRTAIEKAYSAQPPDDEVIVLTVKEDPNRNVIVGEYAWSRKAKQRAGEMEIMTNRDQIARLTVRYER